MVVRRLLRTVCGAVRGLGLSAVVVLQVLVAVAGLVQVVTVFDRRGDRVGRVIVIGFALVRNVSLCYKSGLRQRCFSPNLGL